MVDITELELLVQSFGTEVPDILKMTEELYGDVLGFTFVPERGLTKSDMENLTADALAKKRGNTKEKLADWLATAVNLIRVYYCPLLTSKLVKTGEAVKKQEEEFKEERNRLREKMSEVQGELCESQRRIIRLQKELLAEKDRQISGVATAVKTEMRTYADTVKLSCTESLAPRRIRAAMKTAADTDVRATNLVIYGLAEEEEEENTEAAALAVLEHLQERPAIQKSSRLGTKSAEKIRPILLELRSRELVREILTKAKKLKEVEGMRTVYLSPDRSLEEIKERRLMVDSRREKGPGNTRGESLPD